MVGDEELMKLHFHTNEPWQVLEYCASLGEIFDIVVENKDKALATVIMLNPCISDTIVTDTTTFLVVNNLAALERFGGVEIVNLYSKMTNKLSFRWNSDQELNDEENNKYIQQAVSESVEVVVAWGRADKTNRRVEKRVKEVMKLLEPYKEKISVISDGERKNLHPLTPAVRSHWILEPIDWTEYEEKEGEEGIVNDSNNK